MYVQHTYVSESEERGHFGPDFNFEILICTEKDNFSIIKSGM